MTTVAQLDDLVKSSQKGFRVDVVELAKKLSLPVYSVDLPENESGHICDGDDPYIEVNSNHPITRQRFTIAHEISHYLIHTDLLKAKGKLDRKATYGSQKELDIEAQADQTAASILMPEQLVRSYLKKHNWSKLTKFNDAMIEEIADEFRVSKEMAVTRLRDLDVTIPYLVFA